MSALFLLTSVVAVIATLFAVTRANAVHALLYFVVSLFAAAFLFLLLGAPFVAVLEVIVYAGAIIVLFLFAVMLLNLGHAAVDEERRRFGASMWIGPSLLALVLAVEMVWIFLRAGSAATGVIEVGPKEVGIALFGPYVLAVEIASMLLLAGLVGAYHLGRPQSTSRRQDR
ncbi:MAG: NADH-quinone oxidoreductase subunit J [Candidatus Eiseniibacteriota bacterium]